MQLRLKPTMQLVSQQAEHVLATPITSPRINVHEKTAKLAITSKISKCGLQ